MGWISRSYLILCFRSYVCRFCARTCVPYRGTSTLRYLAMDITRAQDLTISGFFFCFVFHVFDERGGYNVQRLWAFSWHYIFFLCTFPFPLCICWKCLVIWYFLDQFFTYILCLWNITFSGFGFGSALALGLVSYCEFLCEIVIGEEKSREWCFGPLVYTVHNSSSLESDSILLKLDGA